MKKQFFSPILLLGLITGYLQGMQENSELNLNGVTIYTTYDKKTTQLTDSEDISILERSEVIHDMIKSSVSTNEPIPLLTDVITLKKTLSGLKNSETLEITTTSKEGLINILRFIEYFDFLTGTSPLIERCATLLVNQLSSEKDISSFIGYNNSTISSTAKAAIAKKCLKKYAQKVI